ncbi:MAG TPA: lysophospholipid acyltransferase family protein [Chthoniobacterales bacterium]
MRAFWKKIRYQIELAGLKLAVWLIPKLPRSVLRKFADVAGDLVFALDRHGRRVALANLEAAFGESLTLTRRRRIARDSFRNLGRAFLDLFWAQNLTRENYSDVLLMTGAEEAMARHKKGEGIIFITQHFGNFELMSLSVGFAGFAFKGIAQNFKNEALTPIFGKLRQVAGNEIIPQERAILRLLREIKRGGACGFLVDLTLRLDEPSTLIDCFGLKTNVTIIQAWLHNRTGAPIYPLACIPRDDGRYEVRFLPELKFEPGATEKNIAQACWDIFEPIIREMPECWLWAYKHWRYRPRGEEGRRYPFYANESRKFDKRLAEEAKT